MHVFLYSSIVFSNNHQRLQEDLILSILSILFHSPPLNSLKLPIVSIEVVFIHLGGKRMVLLSAEQFHLYFQVDSPFCDPT